MILHKQPVAHILPVAVDRQRLALQRIQNHQRNQLLRKLKRPVVVRAVRGQHRQSEGVKVRPRQMIRPRLRCRVGAVRRVRRRLAECRIVRPQRSIHLIRRNMQKPETLRAPPRSTPLQYARACSSSTNVPCTLVRMNASGETIERSTWLSAAKCTIARGRCLRSSEPTSSASQMSPRTNVYRSSASSGARFAAFPA